MPRRVHQVGFFAAVILIVLSILGTRYQEIDVPLLRSLQGHNRIDPLTLHLSGEFVEGNLGVKQDADGSLTLRMLAEQYFFIPHCVVVPAGIPVHLRITSADAVHVLAVTGTDYKVTAVPGAVSDASMEFTRPGEYDMPCHEFCGAGHYAMRSRLVVVPRDQFPLTEAEEGGRCAAR